MGNQQSQQAGHKSPISLGSTAFTFEDHSQTTATGSSDHSQQVNLTRTSHAQAQTSHTTGSNQLDVEIKLNSQQLDVEITHALTELSMCPGNVRAAAPQPQSASAERSMPLQANGRAKGDVSLADLQRRALKARSPKAKEAVLEAIETEISLIKLGRRNGWYDLGTAEGRYRAGALADRIGVKAAAQSLDRPVKSVYRWRAEFRAGK